jgi:hypothetical protein
VELTPEQRAVLDKAVELARKAVCASAPKHQLIEGMCEEYLGSHDAPTGVAETLPAAPREELDSIKEWLEKESAQWAFLDRPEPVEAPDLDPGAERDPTSSMQNCADSSIYASGGTRSSATSRCSSARWTAGGASASPPSSITPPSGSG